MILTLLTVLASAGGNYCSKRNHPRRLRSFLGNEFDVDADFRLYWPMCSDMPLPYTIGGLNSFSRTNPAVGAVVQVDPPLVQFKTSDGIEGTVDVRVYVKVGQYTVENELKRLSRDQRNAAQIIIDAVNLNVIEHMSSVNAETCYQYPREVVKHLQLTELQHIINKSPILKELYLEVVGIELDRKPSGAYGLSLDQSYTDMKKKAKDTETDQVRRDAEHKIAMKKLETDNLRDMLTAQKKAEFDQQTEKQNQAQLLLKLENEKKREAMEHENKLEKQKQDIKREAEKVAHDEEMAQKRLKIQSSQSEEAKFKDLFGEQQGAEILKARYQSQAWPNVATLTLAGDPTRTILSQGGAPALMLAAEEARH